MGRIFAGSPVAEAFGLCWTAGCVAGFRALDFELPRADRTLQGEQLPRCCRSLRIGVASRGKRSCWLHLARKFPSLRGPFAIPFADLGKRAVSIVFHFAQHLGN